MKPWFHIPTLLVATTCLILTTGENATASGELTLASADTVDLGTYPGWESRVAGYLLANSGDTDLEILDVRNSCGCATVGFTKKTLTPKEATTLNVTILPNSIFGNFQKPTYIRSSDISTPLTKVWVKGNAEPLVEVKPRAIVSAGILEEGRAGEWSFTLRPTRSPVALTEPTTTSSVPVEVSLSEAADDDGNRTLRVQMPPPATATKLNIGISMTATYGTNTVPLSFGITGLVGTHLVAIPGKFEIPPGVTQGHWMIRLHMVAPPNSPRALALDSLETPAVPGVTFTTPTRDHTGKGLLVNMKLDEAFISRIQKEEAVPLTFRVPGAAPATVKCVAPGGSR